MLLLLLLALVIALHLNYYRNMDIFAKIAENKGPLGQYSNFRSEERRVGKEGRARWAPDQ